MGGLSASVQVASALEDVEPSTERALLADGGSVCNPPLISLLQRRVETVVCFCNVGDRLPPAAEWDPRRLPVHTDFSDDVPPLFGLSHPTARRSAHKVTERNAVFRSADFVRLIDGLHASQRAGRGGVCATRLTTVANAWWGIPAGQEVTVVWCYLCRAAEWETALPAEVRKALPERAGAEDPASSGAVAQERRQRRGGGADAKPASRARKRDVLKSAAQQCVQPAGGGPLDGFPQYPLTRLRLPAEQVRTACARMLNVPAHCRLSDPAPFATQVGALHQLSGWVVTEHAALLKEHLQAVRVAPPP